MAIKKPTKKEWIYIGVAAVALLLWWLFSRSGSTRITNGAGQTPDTSYLNFNIPPIGSNGLAQPSFGGINIPPVFMGGGNCNQCYQPKYYGSNEDLANALGQTGADAVNAALSNLPNYMTVNVQQQYQTGSLNPDDVNYAVLSQLPVLALGGGTTSSIMDQSAQTSNYAPLAIAAL